MEHLAVDTTAHFLHTPIDGFTQQLHVSAHLLRKFSLGDLGTAIAFYGFRVVGTGRSPEFLLL